MSQQSVGIVISRLLNNGHFRVRFTLDRIGTLAELFSLGIELTPDEIDVFIQTDPQVWFWGNGGASVGCTDGPPSRNP